MTKIRRWEEQIPLVGWIAGELQDSEVNHKERQRTMWIRSKCEGWCWTKSTASPNVTEAKWVPMGTFFSFWVHFVNNLFPLYSNELAYFLQFCLLGPYSAGGGSHLVHFSLKKNGSPFWQNLVPIAFGFSAIHIADKCQKRLLKAGPNTYIAHIFHIQTQAVKLSHPEGI